MATPAPRDAEVYVIVTTLAGQVRDLEVLNSPPRWQAEPGQTCRVANVNGGDSAPYLDPARGWEV